VVPGAPAAEGGVRPGDVLLSVNGVDLEGRGHYLDLLRNFTRGQKVRIEVARNGTREIVTLRLAPFSDEQALEMAHDRWGIQVRAGRRNLLVAGVRPGSPAANLGLEPGDVLAKIGGREQEKVEDFAAAFKRFRMHDTLILLVGRKGQGYYVRLRM